MVLLLSFEAVGLSVKITTFPPSFPSMVRCSPEHPLDIRFRTGSTRSRFHFFLLRSMKTNLPPRALRFFHLLFSNPYPSCERFTVPFLMALESSSSFSPPPLLSLLDTPGPRGKLQTEHPALTSRELVECFFSSALKLAFTLCAFATQRPRLPSFFSSPLVKRNRDFKARVILRIAKFFPLKDHLLHVILGFG